MPCDLHNLSALQAKVRSGESREPARNGYYGDNKKAWIVQVTPTDYGRTIFKFEVAPDTVELTQSIEKKVREKLTEAETLSKYWKGKGNYASANYFDTVAQVYKDVLEEAEPITGPKYNYTEWKD